MRPEGPGGEMIAVSPQALKFATPTGLPNSAKPAALRGDPTKGPSVMVLRTFADCPISWRWHTPPGRRNSMWKRAGTLRVEAADRLALEALTRAGSTPQKVALRARIVLGAAAGQSNSEVARALDTSRPTVLLWRARYADAGVPGLLRDAPRPGRRCQISAEHVQQIVEATLHTTPRAATHWSTRTMAR